MQQPARRVLGSASTFTCRGCLANLTRTPHDAAHPRRAFSGTAPRRAAAPDRPSPAGLAQLRSRKLISVSGPDAAKYLQGVITANLFPGPSSSQQQHQQPRTDAGFYAAFLTAQGRVLHDVFVYRDVRSDAVANNTNSPGDSWLLEVDAAEADRLQRHIKRYKLRAKFAVRVLDEGEASVFHLWDDNTNNSALTAATDAKTGNIITLLDTRAPNLGTRVLTFNNTDPTNPLSSLTTSLPPLVDESAYHLRRILSGIPEGQSELLREQALPHESNLDATDAVDFRKGCYVGQELAVRTQHRGVVRKRVLPCLLYNDDAQPQPSAAGTGPEGGEFRLASWSGSGSGSGLVPELEAAYRPQITADGLTATDVPREASIGRMGKKGRSAGKWLGGIGNVGLALCRLEIMTDVVLPGEVGGSVYTAGDEFVVGLGAAPQHGEGQGQGEDGGKKVKIRAFVPGWLRGVIVNKEGH